jgi:lipopolysaccharide transport system ATP-binding protein
MEITAVHLLDEQGRPAAEFPSGSALRVQIAYNAPHPIPSPIFSVTISRQDGLICYDTNNTLNGPTFPPLVGRGLVELSLERLDLVGGEYYVDVGVYEQAWAYAYDFHWHVYPLTIATTKVEKGILQLPHRWQIQTAPANRNGSDQAFNNDVKTISSGGVKQ